MVDRIVGVAEEAIRERWNIKERKRAERSTLSQSTKRQRTESIAPSQTPSRRRGRFSNQSIDSNTQEPATQRIGTSPMEDLESLIQLSKEQLRRNIHFATTQEVEGLVHFISYILPGLVWKCSGKEQEPHQSQGKSTPKAKTEEDLSPIRLIIIDSLPPFFETASTGNSLSERSLVMTDVANKLKRISLFGCKGGIAGNCESSSEESLAWNGEGSAVIVVNHTQEIFQEKDKILARIAIKQGLVGPLSRSRKLSKGSIPISKANLTDSKAGSEPPMDYALQNIFNSGCLASVPTSWPQFRPQQNGFDNNQSSSFGIENFMEHSIPVLRQAGLGQSWSNSINVRLMLFKPGGSSDREIVFQRLSQENGSQNETSKSRKNEMKRMFISDRVEVRRAVLVFSPFVTSGVGIEAKECETEFIIFSGGVRSIASLNSSGSRSNTKEGRINDCFKVDEDGWLGFDLGQSELEKLEEDLANVEREVSRDSDELVDREVEEGEKSLTLDEHEAQDEEMRDAQPRDRNEDQERRNQSQDQIELDQDPIMSQGFRSATQVQREMADQVDEDENENGIQDQVEERRSGTPTTSSQRSRHSTPPHSQSFIAASSVPTSAPTSVEKGGSLMGGGFRK